MSGWSHRIFICPFYENDEKMAMICTGDVRVEFDEKKDLIDYQKKYCASFDYAKCPIAERKIKEYEQG